MPINHATPVPIDIAESETAKDKIYEVVRGAKSRIMPLKFVAEKDGSNLVMPDNSEITAKKALEATFRQHQIAVLRDMRWANRPQAAVRASGLQRAAAACFNLSAILEYNKYF